MSHLRDIGESYWRHFAFAVRISFVLLLTAVILFIHALFPNVFKDTTYSVIKHLHAILDARRNGEELPEYNENETGVE